MKLWVIIYFNLDEDDVKIKNEINENNDNNNDDDNKKDAQTEF